MRYSEFVGLLFNQMANQSEALMHGAIGIAGEGGEVLDCVKKHWVYKQELNRDNLVEEMGDCCFYLQALMNITGITYEEIINANVAKLSKRYPNLVYRDEDAALRRDKQED